MYKLSRLALKSETVTLLFHRDLQLSLVPTHSSYISHFFCCYHQYSRNLACVRFQLLSQLLFFSVLSSDFYLGYKRTQDHYFVCVFICMAISFISAWGWNLMHFQKKKKMTWTWAVWVTGVLLLYLIWMLPDIHRTLLFHNPSVCSFFYILKHLYSCLLLPFLSLFTYLFFNQALVLIFCQHIQLTDNTLFWSWLNAS